MINPLLESLNTNPDASFLIRFFEVSEFMAPYHFHPEYELTLILRGNGTRYVGNQMAAYQSGDLVLLGPNLPHCWKTTPTKDVDDYSSSIVIQFDQDFLGTALSQTPELSSISALLKNSSHGITFNRAIAKKISRKMQFALTEKTAYGKLMAFIDVLKTLSLTSDYHLIEKKDFNEGFSSVHRKRINEVVSYIVDHFHTDVSVKKAAGIAHMSVPAFCRYFKGITDKTFSEVVNEYRINFAVQQLIHSDTPVKIISYQSGFTDISHFYKLFKHRFSTSPLQYRKTFLTGAGGYFKMTS